MCLKLFREFAGVLKSSRTRLSSYLVSFAASWVVGRGGRHRDVLPVPHTNLADIQLYVPLCDASKRGLVDFMAHTAWGLNWMHGSR